MKKFAFAASVVFVILTFAGAGFVVYTGGQANAGYAVVPMVFALASLALSRRGR